MAIYKYPNPAWKQFLLGQKNLPFENSDHKHGDMTLGEGHDTPFDHGAIEWNIQTEHENKQLWPRQGNLVCVYCGMILPRLTVFESSVNVPLLGSVIWNNHSSHVLYVKDTKQ